MGDQATDTKNQSRERGQWPALQQSLKNLFKPGNHKLHEQAKNGKGKDEHGARINHGCLELALQPLGLLQEVSETPKRDFQRPADFACFDHIDVKAIEDSRLLRERLG